ncbi:hypothetical protein, partial [Salmonella enterica]|uniref:hypothetical protein n=1 Tax=Salmonella enterica TaxID=28901 RepID=UPI000B1738F3
RDEFGRALVNACQALGVKERNIRQGVKQAAETAAALFAHACIEKKGDKPRATSPKHIIDKIFLAESLEGEKESELALRGLMLLRALPDSVLDCDKPDAATPAFRVHTFVRNIEGFFASVSPGERKAMCLVSGKR